MFEALRELHESLDPGALRVQRPIHAIFLCGGVINPINDDRSVPSLRDYLYRVRSIENRLDSKVILAETAQQLYRDTNYEDLISFEEDIARITSIVLVISESPGSLAELGAFASESVIRDSLRLIISEDHANAESFVRYGPIKRIENINRDYVGVFPWRTHKKNNAVVKASVGPHFSEMLRFIRKSLEAIPDSFGYAAISPEKAQFFDILWIISLLEAVPPDPLYDAVRIIHPGLSDQNIRNLLYVLRVCKWVDSFSYANRDYFYLPANKDPFDYAFLPGRRIRDIEAKKLQIANDFKRDAGITKAIFKRLQEKRKGKP